MIRTVRDPAVAGYAHAGVVTRPWMVYVDGEILADKRRRPRRFSTEGSAIAAARRAR